MFKNLIYTTRYIQRSLVYGLCLCLVTHSSLALWDPMDCSLLGSSVHGDSPGNNTGVESCPPSGNLPNPGIKLRSSEFQANYLPSEPPGKPMNTGAFPFSRGSSRPRNRTAVFCIAGGFFTSWILTLFFSSFEGSCFSKAVYLSIKNYSNYRKCLYNICL